MQANGYRERPPAGRSISGVPLPRAVLSAQRTLRSGLRIIGELISVTRRAWGLGLRVNEREGGE